jgi:hypothetical protein
MEARMSIDATSPETTEDSVREFFQHHPEKVVGIADAGPCVDCALIGRTNHMFVVARRVGRQRIRVYWRCRAEPSSHFGYSDCTVSHDD